MNGILNIDKPAGITSFGVVSVVKRLSGEHRVGHAGTLDPAATGVLPVCLGQGTRVIEFLIDATKTYRAEIEFGVVTDTYDREGRVTRLGDPSRVNRDTLESALASFCGVIEQVPPPYSALKYQGKPLYQLARAGIVIEPKSRRVTIHKISLVDWQPPVATVEVVCSKGTYIRSLAHDLGQVLGCGAHLKSLIRLRYGLFDINEAISLSGFEDAVSFDYWERLVYPIDSVLAGLPAVVVSGDREQDIRNGRPLVLQDNNLKLSSSEEVSSREFCRAYTQGGSFLAVLRFTRESGYWQPEKVFL
jgi:tRNA pseudouridine55 synthase